MRILLTGASGFLGTELVRSLLRSGDCRIRAQSRQPPTRSALALQQDGRIEFVTGNLLSRADCQRLTSDIDVCIHAAAGTRGETADMYMNSVVATRNLLEAAGHIRRFCLVSSLSVYDTYHLKRNAWLDESTQLETGQGRGPYAFTKIEQEALFLDYQRRIGFEHVIVRPAVIYGPGGSLLSSRVGIRALGLFAALGGSCPFPLTQVQNCAEAIVCATDKARPGATVNIVDDDLPTCAEYLRLYRSTVKRVRVLPVPYPMLAIGSRLLSAYARRSKGQIPAILTPYIVRSTYRPFRYSNDALKAMGWTQRVGTRQGLLEAMQAARSAVVATGS